MKVNIRQITKRHPCAWNSWAHLARWHLSAGCMHSEEMVSKEATKIDFIGEIITRLYVFFLQQKTKGKAAAQYHKLPFPKYKLIRVFQLTSVSFKDKSSWDDFGIWLHKLHTNPNMQGSSQKTPNSFTYLDTEGLLLLGYCWPDFWAKM